jgi:uncharacterized phage-associated protein
MSALDVAAVLLRLAAAEEEPEAMTQTRLHKLLYYVQGWHLAVFSRPLFADRIEAWQHGPVVKSLRGQFAAFGDGPIPPDAVSNASKLTSVEESFVKATWGEYKQFSASGLRNKTHAEAPWLKAWGARTADAAGTDEITQESMREFFVAETRRRGYRPEDVAGSYIGMDQIDRGEVVRLKDVMARAK